ncbi:hypothetical protein GQR58_011321 [Nymphon striatum]|nr:hypothetical protein GQR58_011321 [Nymphon striatum]
MTVKRKFILLSERFAKRVPLVTLADTSTATSGRSARCGRLVDMEVELPTGNLLEETTDPIAESLFGANDDSDMIYLKSMDFQEVYLHCVKSEVEELRTFEADVLFPVRPYQERLRIFMDESWLEDANNMTVGDHVQIEFESHATRGIIKYKGLVPEKSPEGIMFGVELKGEVKQLNEEAGVRNADLFNIILSNVRSLHIPEFLNIPLMNELIKNRRTFHKLKKVYNFQTHQEDKERRLGHKEEGNCDGSISGKRYFTCAPNSGLFVSALNIRSAGVSLGKHGSFDGQNFSDLLTHQSTTGSNSSKSKSSGKHSTSVATSNSFSEAKVSKSGPPLDINNRVVWISDIGPEYGYVRWIGNLPEVRDDWMVGVEFTLPSILLQDFSSIDEFIKIADPDNSASGSKSGKKSAKAPKQKTTRTGMSSDSHESLLAVSAQQLKKLVNQAVSERFANLQLPPAPVESPLPPPVVERMDPPVIDPTPSLEDLLACLSTVVDDKKLKTRDLEEARVLLLWKLKTEILTPEESKLLYRCLKLMLTV